MSGLRIKIPNKDSNLVKPEKNKQPPTNNVKETEQHAEIQEDAQKKTLAESQKDDKTANKWETYEK